ncbi:hypothetical protein CJF42_15035 [Pseudoalteromonas sp. NBT06-2]|uniref:outer membrane beta-barrel protein n=1 Tax=Pseudoalteromonas sp. NBT06-2 TaxID=2025950 RepID=UPI000BA67290|nr:outer membrane beta-barrel protein [Pseudoalteromonas sp. NBT06-2]PAJ73578.1 hypothetical protein CJF42_15035 [Pseudoalteromonas sp. NBT06-2]
MKFLINSIFLILATMSCFALSNEQNTFSYYGIALQKSSFEDIQFKQNQTEFNEPLKYNKSTSGVGARIFTGFNFNEYIAAEAGLSQFAKPDFSVTEKITNADQITKITTHNKGDFSTLGLDIRAIASYSLTNDIFLRAQVGVLGWDNKSESLVSSENDTFTTIEAKDRGISLLTGLGIGYGINKKMAFTFDYESTEVADIPVKTLTLGFSFKL